MLPECDTDKAVCADSECRRKAPLCNAADHCGEDLRILVCLADECMAKSTCGDRGLGEYENDKLVCFNNECLLKTLQCDSTIFCEAPDEPVYTVHDCTLKTSCADRMLGESEPDQLVCADEDRQLKDNFCKTNDHCNVDPNKAVCFVADECDRKPRCGDFLGSNACNYFLQTCDSSDCVEPTRMCDPALHCFNDVVCSQSSCHEFGSIECFGKLAFA